MDDYARPERTFLPVRIDLRREYSRIGSLMVAQSRDVRIQRVTAHEGVVSAHYRKALANIEFYPKDQKVALREQLVSEYENFTAAATMLTKGTFVREIQKEICSEARSWLTGNIPATIARYSFCQVSEAQVAVRSVVSEERIKVCRQQMKSALDTVSRLEAYDGISRKKDTQAIKKEFASFKLAFQLYARGFSFEEIRSLTSESIQARVEDKTIPEKILAYAGYPLTASAQSYRVKKSADLKSAIAAAFEEAKAKQGALRPDTIDQQVEVWRKEIATFNLVVDLYEKGLTTTSIAALTGTNADGWLSNGQLPVKLTRARLDLVHRDYKCPTVIDESFAYVAGAMYANQRSYSSESGIIFRNADQSKIAGVKSKFDSVFQTTLADPSTESGSYVARVGRSGLLKDIFDMLGIQEGARDPLPPLAMLTHQHTRRGFLRGYFDFCRPHVNPDLHRFGVSRRTQPNLIKAVALALYAEKIYPIARENGAGFALAVNNEVDFRKLVTFAPEILSPNEKRKLGDKAAPPQDPIGSYEAYRSIVSILKKAYGDGRRLDFQDILSRAGIMTVPHDIPDNIKSRISNWRRGLKPLVAQRAEAIERLAKLLYPELA